MYIEEEYQLCSYVRPKRSWILTVVVTITFGASFLGYFLKPSEEAQCSGVCIVPQSQENDVHIYYGTEGQELNISVYFKANPKTAFGTWTVGDYAIGTWYPGLAWQRIEQLEANMIHSTEDESYDYIANLRITKLTNDMVGISSSLLLENERGKVRFRFNIRCIYTEVIVVVVVFSTSLLIIIGLACAYNRKKWCSFFTDKAALNNFKDNTESDCEKPTGSIESLPLELDKIYNDWANQFEQQNCLQKEEENTVLCCLQRRSCRKNCSICWKYFPICNKDFLECCLDCNVKVVCGTCGCCCEYINSDGSGQKPGKEMPRQTTSHEWDKRQAKNLKNLTVHIGDGGKTKK